MFFKPGHVVTVKTDKGYFRAKVWARGPTDCMDEEPVHLSFACHGTVHFWHETNYFYLRPILACYFEGFFGAYDTVQFGP